MNVRGRGGGNDGCETGTMPSWVGTALDQRAGTKTSWGRIREGDKCPVLNPRERKKRILLDDASVSPAT